MSYLLQYNFNFGISKEIPTNPAKIDEYLKLSKGILSIDPESDEETETNFYYDGLGKGETDVLGMTLSWSFEGHRSYGDPAQDLILNELFLEDGNGRKVYYAVFYPDGIILHGPATISEIKTPGGEANKKGEISFKISFDGKPEKVSPTAP